MKLELLSDNLVLILNEICKYQNICKLIYYDKDNPLSQADLVLPYNSLIKTRLLPYMTNPEVLTRDITQVCIYYPSCDFVNGDVIEMNKVHFDVICGKTLWLINDGEVKFRPYEIMKEIKYIFNDSISTIGKIHFQGFRHIPVNEKFDCVRLIGDVMTIA